MDWETMYDLLIDYGIATEEEISLVTAINGTSTKTMEDILFVREGIRSFEDLINFD